MKVTQIAGIILFLFFYGSYVLKAVMEKRRGITVGRMTLGEKPAVTRVIEVFLVTFTCGIAAVQIISIFFFDKWERLLTQSIFVFVGVLLAGSGIVFFILAMRQMKDNWRAGIDEGQETALVTDGIYKISRNPAFVGFDLFYIGFSMIFSNGLMILIALLTMFTFHFQIKEEEKYMQKKFGKQYEAYRSQVRRYL